MQRLPHLLGSRWTARQVTFGWRHFRVINRKNEGRAIYAELVAACDPTARLWLEARSLKNRALWQPGWLTLDELTAVDEFSARTLPRGRSSDEPNQETG